MTAMKRGGIVHDLRADSVATALRAGLRTCRCSRRKAETSCSTGYWNASS